MGDWKWKRIMQIKQIQIRWTVMLQIKQIINLITITVHLQWIIIVDNPHKKRVISLFYFKSRVLPYFIQEVGDLISL